MFDRDKNDIIGTILSKDLLFIDPNDEIPLASFASIFLWPIQSVWPDQRLREVMFYRMFTAFKVEYLLFQFGNLCFFSALGRYFDFFD